MEITLVSFACLFVEQPFSQQHIFLPVCMGGLPSGIFLNYFASALMFNWGHHSFSWLDLFQGVLLLLKLLWLILYLWFLSQSVIGSRKAPDFCVLFCTLTLYPQCLWALRIFWWSLYSLLCVGSCYLHIRTFWLLPSCVSLSVSCLTALAKISGTELNRTGQCRLPGLNPDLSGNALNFSPCVLMLAAVH